MSAALAQKGEGWGDSYALVAEELHCSISHMRGWQITGLAGAAPTEPLPRLILHRFECISSSTTGPASPKGAERAELSPSRILCHCTGAPRQCLLQDRALCHAPARVLGPLVSGSCTIGGGIFVIQVELPQRCRGRREQMAPRAGM
ncbi:unnamed protein product [Symbiodinium natans]|uniref:Uncharacterized protein n=1 Tax=Symbiodinium natans TaxID=878477 RepID=A0A812R647_9DINO|nr:unnamed protein product [Symbiodinium natans]